MDLQVPQQRCSFQSLSADHTQRVMTQVTAQQSP